MEKTAVENNETTKQPRAKKPPRQRTRRSFTAEQKTEIVMEALRAPSAAQIARNHDISANLLYEWTTKFTDAGKEALGGASDTPSNVAHPVLDEPTKLKLVIAELYLATTEENTSIN